MNDIIKEKRRIALLCGGVGGVKLALGLDRIVEGVSIIANTGDDFVHYGLPICPDIDTILYTLSGRVHPAQGWGREDESFSVRTEMEALGETPWFILGDRDVALHLIRARMAQEGQTLSAITAELARRMDISCSVIPMSDIPCPTRVDTEAGVLDFQDYFVRRRCEPVARGVIVGGSDAPASPVALDALNDPALEAIILCPSNPLLSIAPILAIREIRSALERRQVPVLAVSPIVEGTAVKGPTAKMFNEMGIAVTGLSVARQYQGLIDLFVLDQSDVHFIADVEALGIAACATPTLMSNTHDKMRLARFCLDALAQLSI